MTGSVLVTHDLPSVWTPTSGKAHINQGLVTIYREGGGVTKREGGGACEVLPLLKGVVENVSAMLNRAKQVFG